MLFTIPCWFIVKRNTKRIDGLAVCSDPDTPVTFIHPDGKPYNGKTIWSYGLKHYQPWTKHEI